VLVRLHSEGFIGDALASCQRRHHRVMAQIVLLEHVLIANAMPKTLWVTDVATVRSTSSGARGR
jgi:hypothetical protein